MFSTRSIPTILRCLRNHTSSRHALSDGAIRRDLQNMRQAIAERQPGGLIDIRWSRPVLTGVTAPIHIDDVCLGRYKIRINLSLLDHEWGEARAITVVSLDHKDKSYPHPHVDSSGRLCMGEGADAILSALGRRDLVSTFQLVNALLHTYVEGDTYVDLWEFEDSRCVDCGGPGNDSCGCGAYVCVTCRSVCPACGQACCVNCAVMGERPEHLRCRAGASEASFGGVPRGEHTDVDDDEDDDEDEEDDEEDDESPRPGFLFDDDSDDEEEEPHGDRSDAVREDEPAARTVFDARVGHAVEADDVHLGFLDDDAPEDGTPAPVGAVLA